MNQKLIAAALFATTAVTVAFFPALRATVTSLQPPAAQPLRVIAAHDRAHVEVVFVLDTTGSMGGLIAAAKEKIWSIATTMASANEAPEIRMGLVAYRDRGDAYVTRRVDLSSDLDGMYAQLMDLRAQGGGDGPESVNQALHEAVHAMSWSARDDVYKAVFLVGDAPPHMDYANDVPYPQTVSAAARRGIVINTIQAGRMPGTEQPWQHIAQLGGGAFLQVGTQGDAVAIATPFDERLAALSAKLDATRLYYGDDAERARGERKQAASSKLHAGASAQSQARRAAFNASASGGTNLLGEQELVDDVASGRVELDAIPAVALPEPLRTLSAPQRSELLERKAAERSDLSRQIKTLASERDAYIADKVGAMGGASESLDQKLYDAVRTQGAKAGLSYELAAPRY